MVSTSRRVLVIECTYNEANNVGDLERILQRGSVFEGTSSRDGIVGLERDRSQEVDTAEHIDFRGNLYLEARALEMFRLKLFRRLRSYLQ